MHLFVKVAFCRLEFAFDTFGEGLIVDNHAELNIPVLGTPTEVRARDNDKPMIDGQELRVVTDGFAVEPLRLKHRPGCKPRCHVSRTRPSPSGVGFCVDVDPDRDTRSSHTLVEGGPHAG